MLPWKRVVGYTDATLYVAKRDQAKALFQDHIKTYGQGLPVSKALKSLMRSSQSTLRSSQKKLVELMKSDKVLHC